MQTSTLTTGVSLSSPAPKKLRLAIVGPSSSAMWSPSYERGEWVPSLLASDLSIECRVPAPRSGSGRFETATSVSITFVLGGWPRSRGFRDLGQNIPQESLLVHQRDTHPRFETRETWGTRRFSETWGKTFLRKACWFPQSDTHPRLKMRETWGTRAVVSCYKGLIKIHSSRFWTPDNV